MVMREEPHVLGLQETKIQEHHVPGLSEELAELLPDYKTFCKRLPLLITVLRHLSTRTFCDISELVMLDGSSPPPAPFTCALHHKSDRRHVIAPTDLLSVVG